MQQLTFEDQTFLVGKSSHLPQNHWRIVHELGINHRLYRRLFHLVNEPRGILEAAPHGLEEIIQVHHHGLAFHYSLARDLTVAVDGRATFCLIACRLRRRFHPLRQVVVLVLQGVRQLVGEDGLLAIRRNPVQHRNFLGLVVVICRNFLACRLHQKFL